MAAPRYLLPIPAVARRVESFDKRQYGPSAISDSCRPNIPVVPYLEPDIKYERERFWAFLKKSVWTEWTFCAALEDAYLEEYTDHSNEDNARALNVFFQQWCWFALLHEFELACGVSMDFSRLTKETDHAGKVLDTSLLLGYIRSVVLARLQLQGITWDLAPGDIVRWRNLDNQGDIQMPNAVSQTLIESTFEIVAENQEFMYMIRDVATGTIHHKAVPAKFLSRTEIATSSQDQETEEQQRNVLARRESLAKSLPIKSLIGLQLAPDEALPTSQEGWNKTLKARLYECTQVVARVL